MIHVSVIVHGSLVLDFSVLGIDVHVHILAKGQLMCTPLELVCMTDIIELLLNRTHNIKNGNDTVPNQ